MCDKLNNDTYTKKILYHRNGSIKSISYYMNGKLHNDYGHEFNKCPAKIKYSIHGKVVYKKWAINGIFIRNFPTLPALIKLSRNKKNIIYKWYNENNEIIEKQKEKLIQKDFFERGPDTPRSTSPFEFFEDVIPSSFSSGIRATNSKKKLKNLD